MEPAGDARKVQEEIRLLKERGRIFRRCRGERTCFSDHIACRVVLLEERFRKGAYQERVVLELRERGQSQISTPLQYT